MLPFITPRWVRLSVLTAAFLTLLGCSGQNLAGSWHGTLPWRNGEDCRIRLVPEGRFDVSCRDRVTGRTDAWVGAGTYTNEGGNLRFKFVALTERGVAQRVPLPELLMAYEGHGNSLTVRQQNFTSTWKRMWR